MKRAVITILGTIGVPREGQEKAKYYFSDKLRDNFSLKRERYTNMLPLVVDNFEEEIVSIYTQTSKERQKEVLVYEELAYDIEENGFFISEKSQDTEADYGYLLNGINTIMAKYDKVIIDMSHGFRHFPILAIINLIIQNIQNPKKVEFILFAKEIVPFKEYEIIDLKEYLELANLSFMLSTFNQNYTVSSNIRFKNSLYKKIAKELTEFSNHFLSNSLKPLIEGKLIEDIIDNLEKLQKDKSVENFKHYIEDIVLHLEGIRQLKHQSEWGKFYEISKVMDKRGYQLNAITLLFEAIGFYCLESLSHIELVGKRVEEYYQFIKKKRPPEHIYSTYTMTNQIRTLVKIQSRFHLSDERLFIGSENLKNVIIEYLGNVDKINKFTDLLQELEALRNNLAHGNSSISIENVKKSYQSYLSRFEDLCIDKDIFSSTKEFDKISPIDRLNNKWH